MVSKVLNHLTWLVFKEFNILLNIFIKLFCKGGKLLFSWAYPSLGIWNGMNIQTRLLRRLTGRRTHWACLKSCTSPMKCSSWSPEVQLCRASWSTPPFQHFALASLSTQNFNLIASSSWETQTARDGSTQPRDS